MFSSSLEEHLVRLEAVLGKLRSAGLKLNTQKCSFFQTSIKYLGHVVSREGVSVDPEKVEAVREWPVPATYHQLRRCLGFVSFYRRFIPGFAKIAAPLHALTGEI